MLALVSNQIELMGGDRAGTNFQTVSIYGSGPVGHPPHPPAQQNVPKFETLYFQQPRSTINPPSGTLYSPSGVTEVRPEEICLNSTLF